MGSSTSSHFCLTLALWVYFGVESRLSCFPSFIRKFLQHWIFSICSNWIFQIIGRLFLDFLLFYYRRRSLNKVCSCFFTKSPTTAPVARRDNCDGTIYRSQDPWCCSISCTKRGGYLDCKENRSMIEELCWADSCARFQSRNVVRQPYVRLLPWRQVQT